MEVAKFAGSIQIEHYSTLIRATASERDSNKILARRSPSIAVSK